MKNPRLVEALKEMDDARWSARSVGETTCAFTYASTSSAYWSASRPSWTAGWSAIDSTETNKKEVLEILKEKLNEKSKVS